MVQEWAKSASAAQHGLVGDQGTPVNSQHESMQRLRSDDMGLKDARVSGSNKAGLLDERAPQGASHSTPLRRDDWERTRDIAGAATQAQTEHPRA